MTMDTQALIKRLQDSAEHLRVLPEVAVIHPSAWWEQADMLHVAAGRIMDAVAALSAQEAEREEYRTGLKAILKAARGDEKGECWTIRKWMDKRNLFNGDIGPTTRLIEETCKFLLKHASDVVPEAAQEARDRIITNAANDLLREERDRLLAVIQHLEAHDQQAFELAAALESRSRAFHRSEQDRTGSYAGMHGSWMGRVYTNWSECPSHPCTLDQKLIAAYRASLRPVEEGPTT